MFLHLSVILFTGGGHAWQGACMAGGMHGREHAWQWGMHGGGCAGQGGVCIAGEMATAGDGTHPTGMHSCGYNSFLPSTTRNLILINTKAENPC